MLKLLECMLCLCNRLKMYIHILNNKYCFVTRYFQKVYVLRRFRSIQYSLQCNKPFICYDTTENGRNSNKSNKKPHYENSLKWWRKIKWKQQIFSTWYFPVILCQKQEHQISPKLIYVCQANNDFVHQLKSIDVNNDQVDTNRSVQMISTR